MKKNTFVVISLFSIILLFYKCTYSPTEANYKEINLPENKIDIQILDPNSISELRGKVNFAINIDLDEKKFHSIIGFLDSTEVFLYLNNSNQIVFNTENYPDGEYTLSIYLFTSTESGSLADRIGQEVFYVRRDYQVTLFNSPIKTPNITGYSIVDGALSIHWEKYDQDAFKKYELKKGANLIATIIDVNQTSFVDTTFIGEWTGYELITYMLDINVTHSKRFENVPKSSFVSANLVNEEKIELKWKKHPFTKAFGKYVIYGLNELTEISSINDTVIVDNFPRLGRGSSYSLKVYSKEGVETQVYDEIIGPAIGTPFELKQPDIFKYIPEKDLFIRLYNNDLGEILINYYSGENLDLIQANPPLSSIPNHLRTVSDNGEHIYFASYSEIYRIDANNSSIEEKIEILDLLPSDYVTSRPLWDMIVNNNNELIIIAREKSSGYYNFNIEIIDMNTKKRISNLPLDYASGLPALQATSYGQFIKYYDQLFKFNGKSIEKIGSVSYSPAAFSNDNKSMIISTSEKVLIYDLESFQIIKDIPGEYWNISIDPKTGYLGANGKIFDLLTGNELAFIRLNGSGIYQNGYYFCDGYYKYIDL